MANPFDQFDGQNSSKGNPFDQFDQGTVSPTSQQTAAPDQPWGDVALSAVQNIPSSAMNVAGNMAHAALHPLDTIQSGMSAVIGAGLKAGDTLNKYLPASLTDGALPQNDPLRQKAEASADAVASGIKNRYGSVSALKNTLATDPVGAAADASMVLGGVGGTLAKAPGVLGKVGDVASAASRFTNPITLPLAVAKGAARLAPDIIGDIGTRTGETSIANAFKAGSAGGDAAQNFLASMKGNVPQEQSVDLARTAIFNFKAARNKAYQDAMADLAVKTAQKQTENKAYQMQYNARAQDSGGLDDIEPPSSLTFDKVNSKLNDINGQANFQGVDIDPATAAAREKVSGEIANWQNLDPAAFHTPMGFDALKQKLYSIADQYDPGSKARVYVNAAAKAVKDTIVEDSPEYASTMKDYWKQSDDIRQIESELSLKSGTNVGTTLRKLQSVMRNNANTNYGYRAAQVDKLGQYGAQNLPYQLAGQALNKWTPRGLGAGAMAADMGLAMFGGHPAAALALPFMSPRLMGNAAYGLGATARGLRPLTSRLPPLGGTAAGLYGASLLSGNNQ